MEGVSVVVVLLFILGVVLTLLHVMVRKSRAGVLFDKLPGPKPLPWIGNAFEMSLDRAEEFLLIRRNISLYKDLHRFWILHKKILNVYNPEDMETITSSSSHIEKGEFYAFLHPWLNEGLLVSTGNKWHHRRKILTTSFHFNILKHFCKVLEENSQRTAAELQELEDKDKVDVTYHMKKCALYAICETSMGTKLSEDKSSDVTRYKYAIEEVGKLLFLRFIKVWLHPDFLFKISSIGKCQIKMLNILHNFTDKVIRERRAYREANGENALPEDMVSDEAGAYGGKKRYAMLDTLLKAEKRGMIDQAGIREEVDTFMFEGHDTLTSGLIFCLFTLANNRTEQDKAYEEIVSILGKDKKEADLNDYGEMKYLECCLKEALRLYPPVPFFARRLRSEVQLKDYLIPADTECFLHVFDLHRRADLWPEPLEFRPERFLPDAPPRHPYAYLPFSAGPRNCIGQRYAMVTLKSVVASILHQFILEPVTRTEELVFVIDLVLRTENPVYIKLTPRIKAA